MAGNGSDIESKIDVIDSNQDVPLVDSALNLLMAQAVGNKTDTPAGDSLVSLTKIINAAVAIVDGLHDVPGQNSALNLLMSQAIGNKTDTEAGNSIYSLLYIINKHIHPTGIFCAPELANSISLTSDAGVWAAYPAVKTEIIADGSIALPFDFHFLNVTDISANGEYAIALYSGLAGFEVKIGCYIAARTAVQSQEGTRPIGDIILPAETRVSAALSSGNAGANTLKIKLEGHVY